MTALAATPARQAPLMRTITQADLLAAGGAHDARFAVFNADGSLYLSTTAKEAERDQDYWRAGGYEIRQVEGQT